jgi:hypothetical protein
MTRAEADALGWSLNPGCVVIELANGVRLFASSDEEMNDAGCLYYYEPGRKGKLYLLMNGMQR